jgi:general stress protein 26
MLPFSEGHAFKWEIPMKKNKKMCLFKMYYMTTIHEEETWIWTMGDISRLMVAEMRQKNNKNIQLNKQKNQNLKLNTF